jgi:hypothetical protein
MAAQIRAGRITATAWIILTHFVTLLLRVGDPGFRMTQAGPENVLVRPVRQKRPIRRILPALAMVTRIPFAAHSVDWPDAAQKQAVVGPFSGTGQLKLHQRALHFAGWPSAAISRTPKLGLGAEPAGWAASQENAGLGQRSSQQRSVQKA